MNFPECLNVQVSNAEVMVFTELQRRGLTTHLNTQYPFVFDPNKELVYGTTIDFYWHHPHRYAVFIDGKAVHLRSRQERRDELVTAALEKRGIKVDRFLYRAPLRKRRLKEIVEKIEGVLNVK